MLGWGVAGAWGNVKGNVPGAGGMLCELKTDLFPLPAILSSQNDDEEEGAPDYENLQGLN